MSAPEIDRAFSAIYQALDELECAIEQIGAPTCAPQQEPKFKVGELVKLVKSEHTSRIGSIGVVREVHPEGPDDSTQYGVEFAGFDGGHDMGATTVRPNSGWYCDESELESA